MKNSWLVWVFVVGVVITMLFAFNYQGSQDTVPLSEIFPETETYPVDIEFVDSDGTIEDVRDSAPTEEVTKVDRSLVEKTRRFEEKIKPIAKPPIAVMENEQVVVKKPEPAPVPAPVVEKVEAPKPVPVAAAPEKKSIDVVEMKGTPYTIQVASFKDKAKAQKKVEEVQKKDYSAFLAAKDIKGKGTYYRVYIGKFENKADADQHLTKVKKDYAGSFIITPK